MWRWGSGGVRQDLLGIIRLLRISGSRPWEWGERGEVWQPKECPRLPWRTTSNVSAAQPRDRLHPGMSSRDAPERAFSA